MFITNFTCLFISQKITKTLTVIGQNSTKNFTVLFSLRLPLFGWILKTDSLHKWMFSDWDILGVDSCQLNCNGTDLELAQFQKNNMH